MEGRTVCKNDVRHGEKGLVEGWTGRDIDVAVSWALDADCDHGDEDCREDTRECWA